MMKKNPVFVWKDRALIKVDTDYILWLYTKLNYTYIFMAPDKSYMVRCSLDKALKLLPEDEFVKTHRACAVAIRHIQEIYGDIVRVAGEELPLSRQYQKVVKEKIIIIE